MIEKLSHKDINFDQFKRNYYLLKQIELFNQIIFNSRLSKVPNEELKIKNFLKSVDFQTASYF